jgi:outer membrane lipoprotein SlyB
VQLNTPSNLLTLGFAIFLAGCATSAPEIPRYTQRVDEIGYSPSAKKSTTEISTKNIALIIKSIWEKLQESERNFISSNFDVKILPLDSFGVITDVQGADQSTPGTNAGAALGGAVASAAYLDRGLRGHHYSAGSALAIGLLGAALGSSMDSGPSSKFQFRYTIKLGDGEIQYFDEIKSTSFRHSIGICVLTPSLTLISQTICNQTTESIKDKYIYSK